MTSSSPRAPPNNKSEQASPVFLSPGFFDRIATATPSRGEFGWLPTPGLSQQFPTEPEQETDSTNCQLSATPSLPSSDFAKWLSGEIGDTQMIDLQLLNNLTNVTQPPNATQTYRHPESLLQTSGSGLTPGMYSMLTLQQGQQQAVTKDTYPVLDQAQLQIPYFLSGSTGFTPRVDNTLPVQIQNAFSPPAALYDTRSQLVEQQPYLQQLYYSNAPTSYAPQQQFIPPPGFDLGSSFSHTQMPLPTQNDERCAKRKSDLPLRDQSKWTGRLRQKKPEPLQLAAPTDIHAIATRTNRRRSSSPPTSRRSRRASFTAQTGRPGRHVYFAAEKPKADPGKTWIRVNAKTQGLSSRTGKINASDDIVRSHYETLPHLYAGGWSTGDGTSFHYLSGELVKRTYTADEIRHFLLYHPATHESPMVLWIQRAPADSAKRYRREESNKCKFAHCPASVFSRAIQVGHFQVAFDENWSAYADRSDPFRTAGFVHLYCLERFLDFADICRRCDVRPDARENLPEPTGKWAAGLGNGLQYEIAARFVAACKDGTLAAKYPDYPFHAEYVSGEEKPHKNTLNYALNSAKLKTIPASKMNMLAGRARAASQMIVHRGDLELAVQARAAKAPSRQAAKRTRIASDAEGEETDGSEHRPSRPRRRKRRNGRDRLAMDGSDEDQGSGDEYIPRPSRRRQAASVVDLVSPPAATTQVSGKTPTTLHGLPTPAFESLARQRLTNDIARMIDDEGNDGQAGDGGWQPFGFEPAGNSGHATSDAMIDPALLRVEVISPLTVETDEKSPMILF